MIAAVVIHFTIHWNWIESMAKRVVKGLAGKGPRMNRHGYFNVAVDAIVGIGFLLAAISGIYFMFVSSARWAADPNFIFSRTTWDLIHTWSGVTMIAAAAIHFAIHWGWVTKVTVKIIRSLAPLEKSAPRRSATESAKA